jgi:multiple antibiotic resistance protein
MYDVALLLFANSFVTLFSVLDPFGCAASFLALTGGDSHERRQRQAIRAVMVTGGTLLLFTFFGARIFGAFGVSVPALMVAGGVILALYGYRMLEGESFIGASGRAPERTEGIAADDVGVIPVAIPFLAGPAAITTVMLFASRTTGPLDWVALLTAEGIAVALTGAILMNAERLSALLGKTGLRVLIRLMGVILLAMAAEFVLSGVKGY